MIRRLRCPICKRETYWKGNPYRPFCSERCKLIDIASWIGEEYTIPGEKGAPSCSGENEKAKAGGDD